MSKHLFASDLRRFWIAGFVYLLLLLAMVPYSAYNVVTSARWDDFPVWSAASGLVNLFDTVIEPFSVAVFSLVMVLLVFSYLFQARSANMIHSLPANRTTLFRSGIEAALVLMWVPQLIVAALALIPIAVSHTGMFWLAAWWFAAEALMTVFFVGLASLCVMFAGRAGAAALFYFILNFVYAGIRFIANALATFFVYGFDNSFYDLTPWFLTPLAWLIRVGVEGASVYGFEYNRFPQTASELIGLFRPAGALRPVIFAAVGIVFLLLAYVVYRKRRVETAGSFITEEWMKPVFRIGAAAGVSLVLTCIALSFETEAGLLRGVDMMFAAAVFQALVFGLIVYFIAEMLIRRSLRVFTKKQWLGWAVFSVCLAVVLCLVRFDAFGIERKVPAGADVTIMRVYGYSLEAEDPEEIREIHRMIVQDRAALRDCEERIANDPWGESEYVSFTYVMPNGSRVERGYRLCRTDETGAPILERINELVDRPDNAARMLLEADPGAYELVDARIDRLTPVVEDDGDGRYLWFDTDTVRLGLSDADRADLLDAIVRDIEEGHLNVTDQSLNSERYANQLQLDLSDRAGEYPDGNSYTSVLLQIDPTCTHTLAVLGRSTEFNVSELITQDDMAEIEREFEENPGSYRLPAA